MEAASAMAGGNTRSGHLGPALPQQCKKKKANVVSQRKQQQQQQQQASSRCGAQPPDADFFRDAAVAAAAAASAVLPAVWLYTNRSHDDSSTNSSSVAASDEISYLSKDGAEAHRHDVLTSSIVQSSELAISVDTEILHHPTHHVSALVERTKEIVAGSRAYAKAARHMEDKTELRKHDIMHVEERLAEEAMQKELSCYDRLIRAGRIKESLEILEEMDKKGVLDMNKVYHSRFFQECKKRLAVEEAFRFTRLISFPTLSTYNMLLSVCCNAGDTDGAFGAFAALKKAGYKPDCMLYTTLISTCAKSRKVDLLFQVFHEMESAGVEGNVHTYGAMIDGCARAGDIAKAFGIYGSMVSKRIKPDVVIFNTLINACARSGSVHRAFEVFSEMKSANIPLQPNHVTMCSLIDACGRAGETDSAYEAYKMMRAAGIRTSPQAYTAAVHACSHNGDLHRAFSIYEDLQRDGIRPDAVFFSALIDVAGHAKSIDRAYEILQEVERHSIVPDATIFSSLMGVCSNTGNWEKALTLHQRIQGLGIRPTVSTLNALLTALCRGNQLQHAVRSLKEMKDAGVVGNQLTYTLLLEACEKEDAAELALDLYLRAVDEGVAPNLSICRSVIALCLGGVNRRLPPAFDPPLAITSSSVKQDEKHHELWVTWALAVYRQAVSAGVTPTPKLFSQVLGCLRNPEPLNKLFPDGPAFCLQAPDRTKQLGNGFGVYDPRASALYEEASAFGIVPFFKCNGGPISFDAEALPLYTAEVCLLTILKALRHRCAIDAELPSVTITFTTETKGVAIPGMGVRSLRVASRNGQAVAALLRKLRLRFHGKESSGSIRISSQALRRWFLPSRSETMPTTPTSSLLGKSIVEQQRAIRTGVPLPQPREGRPRRRNNQQQ